MNSVQNFLEKPSPVIRALLGAVLVGAILVLISWAAPVITPIMVAGFVAALVAPLYFWLERRGVSSGLALILLVVLVVVVILFMAGLLWVSAQRVIEGVAVYQTGLEEIETEIDSLGIRGASLSDVLSAEQLATILATIAAWVADAVADLLFGLVLVAFILADAKRLFTLACIA